MHLRKKSLQLNYPEIEPAGPAFTIYAGHVRRILKLLIDNAIKFTHSGEVALEVKEEASGFLHFHIKDTGIGVPEDWQEKIFEPFRAVDSSDTRKVGGIGLGLTIAQKLAREIGGDLTLEQSSTEGSTFLLSVPINTLLEEEYATSPAQENLSQGSSIPPN